MGFNGTARPKKLPLLQAFNKLDLAEWAAEQGKDKDQRPPFIFAQADLTFYNLFN